MRGRRLHSENMSVRSRRSLLVTAATVVALAARGVHIVIGQAVPESFDPVPPGPVPRVDDGVLQLGVCHRAATVLRSASRRRWSARGSGQDQHRRRCAGTIGDTLVVRDEGGDVASAALGLQQLLETAQVDVIIGPASSNVAAALLPGIVPAGLRCVRQCVGDGPR